MSNINIKLGYNKSYKWENKDGANFIGYLTEYDVTVNDVLDFLKDGNKTQDEIIEFVKNLKGNYCIVVDRKDSIMIFADIIRSFPIYYSKLKNGFLVSDDPFIENDEIGQIDFSGIHAKEYMCSGFVMGKYTLRNNYFQVQAGECIIYDKQSKKVVSNQYFDFRHINSNTHSESQLIEQLDKVCTDTFKRLIKSLDGRQAVIPLSAGADSKLIAAMLKRLNYKNVFCFTYGREGSEEYIGAKKVAEKLGYEWHFIKYTKEDWKNFYDNNEFSDFVKYGSRIESIIAIQQTIAVKKLIDANLIEKDAVFIPGHAGDFIAGSHIKKFEKDGNDLESVLHKHFSLSRYYRPEIIEVIEKNIKSEKTEFKRIDELENFNWKERQSKFISNDVRNYEFWGYKWMIPLWDKNIVKFWLRVSFDLKFKRKLYFIYEDNYINPFLGIESNNKDDVKSVRKVRGKVVVSLIKKVQPLYESIVAKRVYDKNPVDYYSYMRLKEFKKFIHKYGVGANINTIIINKYLGILKGNVQ